MGCRSGVDLEVADDRLRLLEQMLGSEVCPIRRSGRGIQSLPALNWGLLLYMDGREWEHFGAPLGRGLGLPLAGPKILHPESCHAH